MADGDAALGTARVDAGLMATALDRADRDAGGWLARTDRVLVVPRISFPALDVPAALGRRPRLDVARIERAGMASGDTPVRLLHDAANLIADGVAGVVAITGGSVEPGGASGITTCEAGDLIWRAA